MDPLNYQFVDPQAAILNGIRTSAGLTQMQQQSQDRQMVLQQQQIAQQQALQQQADLRALAMNPNAGHADYARAMTLYPGISENLGKAFKVMDEGQQQNTLNFGSRVYAAQLAGNNDLAAQLLEERAKADPAQAQHYSTMAQLVRQSPGAARTISALTLAGAMGPDKFATSFQNLGTEARADQDQPADLAKKIADAQKAGADAVTAQVAAGNAPTATVLGNEEKRQTILSAEAQRQVASFNAQIAAANSETERGRLTLERDKFVQEQSLKTNQVAQDNQTQFDGLDRSLQTVRDLQAAMQKDRGGWTLAAAATPFVDSGPGVGSFTGKLLSMIPGSDAKDFRAKVDTLKSQQFLAQAKQMSGMGALSDAEGARIERAVASLDPDQSPKAFANALGVIETTLAKGQAKLLASGKLPTKGGAFLMHHPQYGDVSDGDVQRLMTQNPGTTREQVLQFLRSTGGK